MTTQDKKMAEDCIREYIQDEHLPRARMILDTDEICELMQMYHTAKMQEITDEDIEKHFEKIEPRGYGCSWYHGMIQGARAFRDGEIKHKEE